MGKHSLLQGNLPNPGIEPWSPALHEDSLPLSYWEAWTMVHGVTKNSTELSMHIDLFFGFFFLVSLILIFLKSIIIYSFVCLSYCSFPLAVNL